MNNKKVILSSLFLGLCISNAYAVTEQLSAAQTYLLKEESKTNNDVVLNNTSGVKNKALAPNKELKKSNSSEILKKLQAQINLPETGIMDEATVDYIKTFQEENSFNATSTLDYNTWFALFEQNENWKKQTVQQAQSSWREIVAKQVMANTPKFIIVNIPTMTLTGYEWDGSNAKEIVSSRVVVGKPSTQTPLKDFNILSIKYNPTWTPTDGILKRGAYKNGQLNINWVKSHGLRILDSNGQIVSPDNVVAGEKYRFQQPAGDRNALGVLKFETDSRDNIYLHDTNEKHYFGHNTRSYSSGCIRVQDFKELANWLKDNTDVEEKLKRKDTYYEKLNKTPVYITYNQVMFYDSEPLFAPDIYKINNNTEFQK